MDREKISNLIGSSTEKKNTTNRELKINWILYFFILIFLIIIAVVSGNLIKIIHRWYIFLTLLENIKTS